MMHRQRKPGYAAIAILKALKSGSRYGLDLMTATDLPSGTVYPQLGRLEARGLVQAEWESEDVARKEARGLTPGPHLPHGWDHRTLPVAAARLTSLTFTPRFQVLRE